VAYPVPRGVVTAWGDGLRATEWTAFNGGMAFVSDTGTGKTRAGGEHHPAAWLLHASDDVRVQLARWGVEQDLDFRQQ